MTIKILKICDALTAEESELGVEKINPIWANEMSASEFFAFQRSRVEHARSLLLPGELGCALAHINAYKNIVSCGNSAFIFESDIGITTDALHRAISVANSVRGADFIHFAQYPYQFRKIALSDWIFVADTSDGFWGAAAYYVSPKMAEYLLSRHTPYIEKADEWRSFFMDTRFIPYYSPIFVHEGVTSSIFDRTVDRSQLSQNPSLYDAIFLRWKAARLKLFAAYRWRRQIAEARRKL